MTVEQFTTKNGWVRSELEDLRDRIKGKIFSDVVDDEGNQYVDIVMEGGGMLGIALVGYVYALENVGIRFLRIGGTSAGSVNAILMAAAGPKKEKSSDWVLELLANKDFYDFVDGDSDAKDFIDTIVEDSRFFKVIWKGAQVIDNLRDDLGLNPGDSFHSWLSELLKERGVETWAKLQELRLQGNSNLKLRDKNKRFDTTTVGKIALVAADITTQTKVDFPSMADLYWANPNEVNPADFVRASMSIPLFFHPYRVMNLPDGDGQLDKWRKVGYTGNVPDEVLFIDGGINSNFPIDLFHEKEKVPDAPTFGVKLGKDKHKPMIVKKLPSLLGAIFDSARHVLDFDFIIRNQDYRHLVQYLETENFNWLDFKMSDEQKLKLFEVGVKGACDFLTKFDWEKYKELRKALVEVKNRSDDMDSDKQEIE